MFVLPPPSLSLGIIVPDLLGTNSSGPLSPTIEGLPVGGLPPLENPNNPPNKPGAIPPKIVFTPSLIKVEPISLRIAFAASPNVFVP